MIIQIHAFYKFPLKFKKESYAIIDGRHIETLSREVLSDSLLTFYKRELNVKFGKSNFKESEKEKNKVYAHISRKKLWNDERTHNKGGRCSRVDFLKLPTAENNNVKEIRLMSVFRINDFLYAS